MCGCHASCDLRKVLVPQHSSTPLAWVLAFTMENAVLGPGVHCSPSARARAVTAQALGSAGDLTPQAQP